MLRRCGERSVRRPGQRGGWGLLRSVAQRCRMAKTTPGREGTRGDNAEAEDWTEDSISGVWTELAHGLHGRSMGSREGMEGMMNGPGAAPTRQNVHRPDRGLMACTGDGHQKSTPRERRANNEAEGLGEAVSH